jgi:hypothetical protein
VLVGEAQEATLVFYDTFESGGTGAWTSEVP